MNLFNQKMETKKDNELFESNLILTEQIKKLENKVKNYETQLEALKMAKTREGKIVVDNYILEPTPELMKLLNKDVIEHQAIDESKKLKKQLDELMKRN